MSVGVQVRIVERLIAGGSTVSATATVGVNRFVATRCCRKSAPHHGMALEREGGGFNVVGRVR